MKAIILAGGEGTRLRPLTSEIPKGMVRIRGKTITEHVIGILKRAGITEIYLSVGYKKEMMKEFYGDGKKFGARLAYVEEDPPLGTAGPLIVLNRLGQQLKETFMMVNGDNLLDVDIREMLKFHLAHGALATIALTGVKDPKHFGVAMLDGDKITEFIEKPRRPPSNLVNSGYYLLEPEVFSIVARKERAMMERDVFPELARRGKLFGFRCEGAWFDTGTHERLREVEEKWRLK